MLPPLTIALPCDSHTLGPLNRGHWGLREFSFIDTGVGDLCRHRGDLCSEVIHLSEDMERYPLFGVSIIL